MSFDADSIDAHAVCSRPGWVAQTQRILDSYKRFLGRELIARTGSPEEDALALFEATFVVVSHGVEDDPILNYANRTALRLWRMDVETITRTPSRMTAEPMHRDERARLLERTAREGYVDDYQGVRISATGERFRIEQAIVWNLFDRNAEGEDVRAGQAATFSAWTPL